MPEKAQHPLLVKIAPDLTDDDKEDIAAVVTREKVCFCCCVLSKLTCSRLATIIVFIF